jgi:hypothetical protein
MTDMICVLKFGGKNKLQHPDCYFPAVVRYYLQLKVLYVLLCQSGT